MLRVVFLAMPVEGGPVAQVAGKRWRLDIGARQEVSLQLSSVDLPGGAQVGNCQGILSSGVCSVSLNLSTHLYRCRERHLLYLPGVALSQRVISLVCQCMSQRSTWLLSAEEANSRR